MSTCPTCRQNVSPKGKSAITALGGHQGGRVPYGFKSVPGEAMKLLEYCPTTGPVLCRMLSLRRAGYSLDGIATYLNTREISAPSGGRWSHGNVRRVLANAEKHRRLIPLTALFSE